MGVYYFTYTGIHDIGLPSIHVDSISMRAHAMTATRHSLIIILVVLNLHRPGSTTRESNSNESRVRVLLLRAHCCCCGCCRHCDFVVDAHTTPIIDTTSQ